MTILSRESIHFHHIICWNVTVDGICGITSNDFQISLCVRNMACVLEI